MRRGLLPLMIPGVCQSFSLSDMRLRCANTAKRIKVRGSAWGGNLQLKKRYVAWESDFLADSMQLLPNNFGHLLISLCMYRQTAPISFASCGLNCVQMSTIKHENVNMFVGICIVAPNVSLMMLYAHKGCLRDVLQNDNMKLTADFLHSFVLDIANVSSSNSLSLSLCLSLSTSL